MKSKLVVYKNGIRYWASKWKHPDGRRGLKFWSSHDWPFYHASYLPDKLEPADCRRKFEEFIAGAV